VIFKKYKIIGVVEDYHQEAIKKRHSSYHIIVKPQSFSAGLLFRKTKYRSWFPGKCQYIEKMLE